MLSQIGNSSAGNTEALAFRSPDNQTPHTTPIPLPELRLQEPSVDSYCTVSPIDKGGRLADRSPIEALRWRPRSHVHVMPYPHKGIIIITPDGPQRISSAGHLRLSASVRHACQLHTGDRLLVIAYPQHNLLIGVTARGTMSMIKSWLRPPADGGQL